MVWGAIPCNETSLAAGSAHRHSYGSLRQGRSVRLTLAKVACLMAKLETRHKGKISKCTWSFHLSLAADSFQSTSELPAVKISSAALLPCGVTLLNRSLPTTISSCTTSELESRTSGGIRGWAANTLSWGQSCSEQFWFFISTAFIPSKKGSPRSYLSLLPRQLRQLVIAPLPSSQSWITPMQM